MFSQDLEPEAEALFLRLHPDLPFHWGGASAEELARLQAIAGRPLPRFYRWFLHRMGREMGPVEYPTLDFSASRIIASYEQGLVRAGRRFLLIGYETDEVMPLHVFYDFDYPSRDDARVVKLHFLGGAIHNMFDTFREMLTWGEFFQCRVDRLPRRCEGAFKGSGEVVAELDPVMARLGFTKLIPTGQLCALYDRADAAMAISATPRSPPSKYHFFDFGAATTGVLRRILGTIALETRIEVKVRAWNPPLPTPQSG